jgi:hypothetical protein
MQPLELPGGADRPHTPLVILVQKGDEPPRPIKTWRLGALPPATGGCDSDPMKGRTP